MKESRTTTPELPHYMRALLLGEICNRLDIITYLNYFLKLDFKQTTGTVCKGTCPWCGETGSLLCSRINGTCCCESCGKKADFFDIITKHWGFDFSFTLKLLSLQLKKAGEFAKAGRSAV
jgi:hypothetical protein